jgi:hypothetical protein
MVESL